MKYAIEHGYRYVLNMDADFSHQPKYLPALLAGMDPPGGPPVDVMIGSRYVPGGGVEGWPLKRQLMSRAVNLYARSLLGLRPKDCSGAFRCYRTALLAKLDFDAVRSRGYSFQEEILWRLKRLAPDSAKRRSSSSNASTASRRSTPAKRSRPLRDHLRPGRAELAEYVGCVLARTRESLPSFHRSSRLRKRTAHGVCLLLFRRPPAAVVLQRGLVGRLRRQGDPRRGIDRAAGGCAVVRIGQHRGGHRTRLRIGLRNRLQLLLRRRLVRLLLECSRHGVLWSIVRRRRRGAA